MFAGAEPAAAGERIYQHDPLGWVASYRPPAAADPTTAWFAAAYTPAEDGTLTAAGFYATAPNATYEVRVAESVAAVRDAAVAASGTLAAAGYHTVTLDAPVAVTAGRPLVIAVKLTTPGYSFPVAIERPFAGYADATAAAGQSYVSGDGTSWTDMTALIAGTDVCLKGYGVAGGPARRRTRRRRRIPPRAPRRPRRRRPPPRRRCRCAAAPPAPVPWCASPSASAIPTPRSPPTSGSRCGPGGARCCAAGRCAAWT